MPFLPFTDGLWACLIIATVYCAWLHHFLVNAHDLDKWTEDKNNDGVKLRSSTKTTLKYLLEAVTVGMDMDDEGTTQPKTNLGQSVLKITFAFMCVVVSASYTANLAAMLTNRAVDVSPISNIQDCVEQACTLCAHKHRIGFLHRVYPTLTKTTVPFRGTWAIMDEIEKGFGFGMRGFGAGSGYYYADLATHEKECGGRDDCKDTPPEIAKCDAYFFSTKDFEDSFKPALCDYEFKGAPIYWLPISFPVAAEFAPGLSYAIRDMEETKPFSELRQQYLNSGDVAMNKPTCDPFEQNDVDVVMDESNPDQLNVRHFAGPWFGLVVATLFAVAHKILVEREWSKHLETAKKRTTKRLTKFAQSIAGTESFDNADMFRHSSVSGAGRRESEMVDNPVIRHDTFEDGDSEPKRGGLAPHVARARGFSNLRSPSGELGGRGGGKREDNNGAVKWG